MRSVWNGAIRFSLVTFPIKLYSAFDSEKSISFNQLHTGCNGRVAYKKECRTCGEPLDKKGDIVKGYEYTKDQYVIISEEDLDGLKVESSRSIDIEGFVAMDDLDPTLFDTPYYLGPDGPVAIKTYSLFAHTLAESGKVAVGKLVMRGDRETRVVIGPHGSGLILYKMRYPSLMKDMGEVPDLEDEEPKAEELKLAMNLVETIPWMCPTPTPRLLTSDNYNSRLTTIRIPVSGVIGIVDLIPCNIWRLDGYRRSGEETDEADPDREDVGCGCRQGGHGRADGA